MKPDAMKTALGTLLGITLLGLAASSSAAIPIAHWTQVSGAQVYLVESPTIPMVDVQIDFDAGGRRDPKNQPGLANFMAASTAYGAKARGTEPGLDENGLSDAWADLGASFGGSASADRLSFALRTLTYPDLLEKATALAARQLGDASYAEVPWLRDRAKLVASLKEASTRPATLARRAYSSAVYGDHPYGAESTEATLGRISAADMRSLHAQTLKSCNAKVSLVGALSRAQADALVSKLLAYVPNTGCAALPSVPEVLPLNAAQEVRIPFASAQAQVLLGQPGMARSAPDYFALIVGNHILGGGGFTARLTQEVREKRGLTYSVSSFFSPGLHAGAFTISLQTRPDQAAQALAVVREVLGTFVRDGPTEKELQAAKDNLVGGFALRLDSNRKLLDNVASIAWNQLPLDYLDNWTARVNQLSVADIRAAFARTLQPEKMVTVLLGAEDTK